MFSISSEGATRLAATALLVAAALLAGTASAAPVIVGAAGPLSPEQIARGQATYNRVCVSCHGAKLEGTQFGLPLSGSVFSQRWAGRTRAQLSELIRTSMPPRGLGAVSSSAYTDIETYILQANGSPIGEGAALAAATPPAAEAPRGEMVGARPGRVIRGDPNDPHYKEVLATRSARLAKLSPVTDALLRAPPASDWLIWRRTYDGHGFSPLARIDRDNVHTLRAAWSWSLPPSMNEITPIVHEGVMFLHSGSAVQAIDAKTGELLWQQLRQLPDEFDPAVSRVKTVALYGNMVFAPTADGHMLALDARTGDVVWDQEVITDAEARMSGRPEGVALHLNGGPIVVKGKVIVGVSLGTDNARGGCFIVGLDAATGRELWRFHTIARPGEPGGDTWNDAPVEERFGGGVWTAGSYDAELDLVYFGIGNTYTTATLLEPRPGRKKVTKNDGAYTDATVALRPDTGQLAWYYQHHKRDVWDLDWVFEQSVVTLNVDGKPRKLVVTGGKTAIFEALDAATGKFVFAHDLGVQNLVTVIDPKTGEKTVNPAVLPEAGKTKLLCPNAAGARNWPATAFVPETGMLYVPIVETCTDYTYAPRTPAETAAGGGDMRFAPRTPPGHDGLFGRLAALDLGKRQVSWTHRQRMPIAGAALATAGGVVFNGDLDRNFYAYDQRDGKVLWRTRLAAAPESFPVTYEVDGRQYVAIVAGGGSAFGAGARGLVPELGQPAMGLTLTVFELP